MSQAIPGIFPVQTSEAQALQFALSEPLATSNVNNANNTNFQAAISQAENVQTVPAPSDVTTENAGLLALSTPALSLFNETTTQPRSANITGNLTTQQLHDIAILQDDVLKLEKASNLATQVQLGTGASTVDLSVEAQNIATLGTANSSMQLSNNQLFTASMIFTQYANASLTANNLIVLRAEMDRMGLQSVLLNMRTIFLVLQYMGGLQSHIMQAQVPETLKAKDRNRVQPIEDIDAVATESNEVR